jgi:hypothetical protein
LFLVLLGAFALAQNYNLVPEIEHGIWTVVFAAVAVLFLVGYAVSGIQEWSLLIPAAIFGGVAVVLGLTGGSLEGAGEMAGGIFMIILSLPFWVAFLVDRKANWWGLIPGWALAAIGAIVLAIPWVGDDLLPTLVPIAVGLPFLVVYFARPKNWWALIPAGILIGVGVVMLAEQSLGESWFVSLMTLVVALPFWIVYLSRAKEHWWALIPAGIMTTAALVSFIAIEEVGGAHVGNYAGAAFFAGMALTFGALWARRNAHATDWAKYPAVVLALVALVVLFIGEMSEIVWAVALILLGGWLLFRALRPGATGG